MSSRRDVIRRGMAAMTIAMLALVARRIGTGAGLSEQAHPHHRRLRARRRQRHLRPPDRTEAQRAARPAGSDREQAGRRRHHRHRLRGQVAARRLHAAGRRHRRHDHQPGGLQQAALRDAAGPRADLDDRLVSAARRRPRRRPGEQHPGAGGLCQGEPRQGQLRQLLARLPAPHRAAQAEDGRAARAHRLQEQRREPHGHHLRRGAGGHRRRAAGVRAPEGRQGQGAGGDRGHSA